MVTATERCAKQTALPSGLMRRVKPLISGRAKHQYYLIVRWSTGDMGGDFFKPIRMGIYQVGL